MKIDINVPDGKSGDWEIKTQIVGEPDPLTKARAALREYGRIVPAGTYKILYRNHNVIMSNTPDEISDFMHFIYRAKGKVLINGLGLGVVVQALIDKPEVQEIIVIEKSEDVIKLVAPTYSSNPKVTIIHADAFEYQPPKGVMYDAVWHDIWDDICADNTEGMSKLHRKYGKKTKYQDSWCRDLCLRMKREAKAEEERWGMFNKMYDPFG